MRILRWVEAASGVLTSIAGAAAIVYLISIPAYSGETCSETSPGATPICVHTTHSLLDVNGITAIVDLSIVAALVLGVAAGSVWHSRTGRRTAQVLLWGFTAALSVFTFLALLSIGLFLLPSAALAIIAGVCALSWPIGGGNPTGGMTRRR